MDSKYFQFCKTRSIVACLLLSICNSVYGQQAEFIWSEEDQIGSRILLSTYQNGVWSAGESIVEDQSWNILPTLGTNSKNNKLAVWSTIGQGERSILKYSMNTGGGWQDPQVLTDKLLTNLAPVIVFDDEDVGWVLWSANDGDDDDIYMSRFISGRWTEPQRVNEDNDVPDILPEAGMDNAGNIWVSWQTLADDTYVEVSKTFAKTSHLKMHSSNSMSEQQIEQIRLRSNLQHQLQPPAFYKSMGRASFHFPNDRYLPARAVESSLLP